MNEFPRMLRLLPCTFNVIGDIKKEFSRLLLTKGHVAAQPGIGFGAYGDEYARFALIENQHRARQALRGIKKAISR